MDFRELRLTALVRQCADVGGTSAWEELIRRFQPVFGRIAYRVAVRWGEPGLREIDDAVQEVWCKLGTRGGEVLRRIPGDSDEAAFAYFKVIAANTALDYFKAKYAGKRGEDRTTRTPDQLEELSVAIDAKKQIEARILIEHVNTALECNVRDRSIFWLYYRQGFTAKEISAIPHFGLSAKGVESLLHRLIADVRKSLHPAPVSAPKAGPEGESAAEAS
jgi:RNA polymerase sigma-70 factor (ECF subfamily)